MGLVVKVLVGSVLFAGSLVGGLAATGRLNHEGTANIPLLRSFFPAPPDAGAGNDGAHGEHGSTDAKDPSGAHGEIADAPAGPAGENQPSAADASHGAESAAAHEVDTSAPHKQMTGQSLYGSSNEDAGHGKPEQGKAESSRIAKGETHGAAESHKEEHAPIESRTEKGRALPEADFQHLEQALANGRSQYTPGELFRFQGLPAGVTPDQINEAWQRVQGMMQELERRKLVLDQQEQQQKELSEDVSRRQGALGKERVRLEQMQRDLDAKIRKFEEQVKLVRTDEVAALKRNAQTIASFEPEKAVALLEAQWKTDKGQDEVLKLLEFMDKDAVNEIIKQLPAATQQDLLKKRLHVVKEPAASGKAN